MRRLQYQPSILRLIPTRICPLLHLIFPPREFRRISERKEINLIVKAYCKSEILLESPLRIFFVADLIRYILIKTSSKEYIKNLLHKVIMQRTF
ncbi:unnamed protein product [Moneuplotes crassus]|uniref:Uncharacterized protein n=1 Tax=Euplotes crassus TaxID=5936 RepID=A0AAD1XSC7_EUPCR|nr:unnamed protein product [Moneuplotes crassus]